MAAPTQELPSWFTLSSSIFTNANGVSVTSTTLLFLPLTYYGPSIPLDSDWTYGGLTSPASTPPATFGTTFVTTITTVATSSPVATSLSSKTSSATPSATPTPTSISPASTITSLPPTSTPSSLVPFAHTGLAKNALIGVVLGAILGSVFVVFLFLLFLRWRVRRRTPEGEPPTIFSFETPVWAEWHMVENEEEQRPPGAGSSRESRDEARPFLASTAASATPGASGSGQPTQQRNEGRKRNIKPVTIPPPIATAPDSGTADNHSDSSSSTGSGYGTILEPSPTSPGFPGEDPYPSRSGHIIPPGDLVKMHEDDEETDEGEGRYSPLIPPPRLVDPGRGVRASYASHGSWSSDPEDVPALFTARRVRVQDLVPRTSPVHEEPETSASGSLAGPSRWAGGLAAGLGRLSWFRNVDSSSPRNSRSNSRPASWLSRNMNETEVEAGRSLLSEYKRPSPLGLRFSAPDERPQSTVSARTTSGNSLYFDAVSSLPGTPPPHLSPLPRALTPTSHTPSHGRGLSLSTAQTRQGSPLVALDDPPTFDDGPTHILDTQSPTQLNLNMTLPTGVDILDIPAPPPISPFASTTSSSSLRTFSPPNLAISLPTPKAWMGTDGTQSVGSFLTRTDSTEGPVGITVDFLEQEPPTAGVGWRSLAGGIGSPVARGQRTTFGPPHFIHPQPPIPPEHASLHSMRSHLSPAHSSAGSAPASAKHVSGSNSIDPSGHSAVLTGSSGSGLSRAGSVTSVGRRRWRGTAISPTLSAFGQHDREHSSVRYSSPPRSPLGHAHTAGDGDGDGDGNVPMSPLMHFPDMPWASGV